MRESAIGLELSDWLAVVRFKFQPLRVFPQPSHPTFFVPVCFAEARWCACQVLWLVCAEVRLARSLV